ncbi:hypothetical protein TWF718_008195 [Orbilia javanica]|uniref:Uncharacterized protein n=1 Tax=Orbilia javanica TaxID=47235 RepID=A0AAN8RMR9_9PEZI
MGVSTTTIPGTTLMMAGGAAAAVPVGSYIHAADNPRSDTIHSDSGDTLHDKPLVTKCIITALSALIAIGFIALCIWRYIRHRRFRRRNTDVEIANVSRHRRRASRRRRYREPPPPYSAAAIHQPLSTRYLEENQMTTIDRIENRSVASDIDSDLPTVPAPAYKQ